MACPKFKKPIDAITCIRERRRNLLDSPEYNECNNCILGRRLEELLLVVRQHFDKRPFCDECIQYVLKNKEKVFQSWRKVNICVGCGEFFGNTFGNYKKGHECFSAYICVMLDWEFQFMNLHKEE